MFIIAKKNFLIRRRNGETYKIPKDFAGELPDDIAGNWLIRAAVASGSILTPGGTADQKLQKAADEADKKASEHDIRPDAKGENGSGEEDSKEDEKKTGNKSAEKK